MNEVFLKGVIVSADKPEHQAAENNHLVYQLRMTHRNRQGAAPARVVSHQCLESSGRLG